MKARKNKKGISLIVLVITIIVMVILAAAIIISISNSGIVNRANTAVDETNEKQMKELVSLAWAEAYLKDTTEAKDDAYFYDEVIAYLKGSGITDEELAKYDITADKNGADANLKTKNEYGFYFDKLYAGTMTQGEYTFGMGMVFRKDQTAEVYIEGSVAFQLDVDGADNLFYQSTEQVTYAKNQVIFTDEDGTTDTFVFENEGSTIDIVGCVLTLNSQEVRGVYYNKYAVGSVNVSGTAVAIKGILYNDNTMEFTIGTSSQIADVQVAANGHYITGENISAVYVSVDGKYLVSSYASSRFLLEVEESSAGMPDEPQSNLIPEGATYYVGVTSTTVGDYTGATATYVGGDEFPDTTTNGDVYVYGDYEYRYNMAVAFGKIWTDTTSILPKSGWGVRAIDLTKSTYGVLPSVINGQEVIALSSTFEKCTNLLAAPTIPNTIIMTGMAFFGCEKLTAAPILPSSVEDVTLVFSGCKSLNTYVGSVDEEGDFTNYTIPSAAKSISGMFYGCTSLVTAPTIPSTVTNMEEAFERCTSLVIAPAIPSEVTDISYAFEGCTSLTTVASIPSKVTDMRGAFSGCTSLTGNIEINANPTEYDECFADTKKSIVITGSCTSTTKTNLIGTATNENVS